jgi:hypothetical protein
VVRLLGTFLFGVSAVDPTILAAVVALLADVALVAAYLPARPAANLDPIATLLCEQHARLDAFPCCPQLFHESVA